MRRHREGYLPMVRVYEEERERFADDVAKSGNTEADFIRLKFGFEPEQPPKPAKERKARK